MGPTGPTALFSELWDTSQRFAGAPAALAEYLQGPLPRLGPRYRMWNSDFQTGFNQNCCVLVDTPEIAGTRAYNAFYTQSAGHTAGNSRLPVRTEFAPPMPQWEGK